MTLLAAAREVEREFLLSFWKVHILHHAGEEPVVGQWMMRELRRHGYEVSPGTLYPLLARMARRGWLRSRVDPNGGRRARKEYTLTRDGRSVLKVLHREVVELHREVVLGEEHSPSRTRSRRRRGSRRRQTSPVASSKASTAGHRTSFTTRRGGDPA